MDAESFKTMLRRENNYAAWPYARKNTKQEGGAFQDVWPLCVGTAALAALSLRAEEQKGEIRDGAQKQH